MWTGSLEVPFFHQRHHAPVDLRYKFTECRDHGKRRFRLAARQTGRQPSAICAKLGIPSVCPLPRLPLATEKPQGFKQKGKELKTDIMAMVLKDRKEKTSMGGSEYELTLSWNRENIRRCAFGMPPELAHIRKDGRNFALIDCCSSMKGFSITAFCLALEKPEWRVLFPDKDISTMPFGDILKSLPKENNEL